MRIVAEETVDHDIVIRLRKDGHEVRYVSELSPGILDEEVLVLASEDNYVLVTVLVTADKDFGELLLRQNHVRRGIVLYRRTALFIGEKAEIISRVIARHGEALLRAFTVVTRKTVRIRPV